jgi:hypothetical protein
MPTNSHLNMYDRLFRSMMSNPKVIREFFEQNLPNKIKSTIDFATVELQKRKLY